MLTPISKNFIVRHSLVTLSSLLLFLTACEPASKPEKLADIEPEKERKVMKINVDMEKEQKSQDSADQGFREWKNQAKDVAEECIIGKGIGAYRRDAR